jgi:hypothetical protein
MTKLKEYSTVRVVKLLLPADEYDGWDVNQRDPQIGDTGILIDILHAPNLPDKYVVENMGSDARAIWLSDFFAEEIESIDPPT